MSHHKWLRPALLTAVLMMGFNNCGKGTTTGNPKAPVSLRFAPYDASAKASSGFQPMAVASLVMCLERLRFKTASIGGDEEDIDVYLGEVTLSPSGTDLPDIEVPYGTYERIEFDLDEDCASGRSLQVQNGNGFFFSTDNITIRFEGNFTADEASASLELFIQNIVSALNTVASNSQVRSKAEGASGSF